MKFRFAFEKLLEHYKLQEELAKRDYFESLGKLEKQKGIYQAMNDEMEQSYDDSETLKNTSKAINISHMEQLEFFRQGQQLRMRRQMEIIDNYSQIVDAKQDVLINAAKEVKMLEKLKEKKYGEFKKEMKKREAKINDELVVTRFRRRGA